MDSLNGLGVPELRQRWRDANDSAALDAFTFMLDPREFRTVPADWLPRLIPAAEWETISRGVTQRLKAINHFLFYLYCGDQQVVPPDVMYSCQYFNPELQDFRPASDVFVHIYGIDLVHMGDGRYIILEDNLRHRLPTENHSNRFERIARVCRWLRHRSVRYPVRLPRYVRVTVRHRLAGLRAAHG
jgi:uncharacterized circularly permuted ATP-grasp superfamily protein